MALNDDDCDEENEIRNWQTTTTTKNEEVNECKNVVDYNTICAFNAIKLN